MPLMFNSILRDAEIAPKDVRLLRHKDSRSAKGRTPYELWRDDPSQFEWYQSTQKFENRKKLSSPYWASFVGTPNDETVFAGLYNVKYRGPLERDTPHAHMDGIQKAGSCDVYKLTLNQLFSEFIGRLLIDWGASPISWAQYADRQDKQITELRTEFKEPDFPGFLNFVKPLSELDRLPKGWIETLKNFKGVYLLTCPKTKLQYVGSATGKKGFWQRWQNYVLTGHGGNVGLKNREPSDYQVSILEVAGSRDSDDDIEKAERLWQGKLQSHEMGLNRHGQSLAKATD